MPRYEGSIDRQQSIPTISRRMYNALTYGLVTVSFIVLWGTYQFAAGGGLDRFFSGNPLIPLIAFVVATILGIILMSVGKSKQNVGLSAVGYVLFSLTFGFTVSLALQRYDVGTITYAFAITACVSGIFLVAGVTFPQVFSRIGGVLIVGLIGVMVVEFVAITFFHADQTIFDYIVIALFCGFLGYDSYRMSVDDPTVPNAIYHASDIYIDIVNILIRVLDILDRD
ncbi:MAG: US12 family protein [Atopobiaceae bacterium]|nr:US12 family protein [Atopobiaceae bacterium]